ncbi:MAG TPA: cation diffusion facilitator family transporter [Actinomycetospora sp.]
MTHEDAHGHGHPHGHGHGHGARPWWRRVLHRLPTHSHDAADRLDRELEASHEGVRALWWSLALLGVTAVVQAVVVVLSGSVALLGDTVHNVADALTAVPLGIAFVVGRRAPTRRYTYGYGRAEDLAGIVVVLVIAASAVVAGWEAVDRLLHPHPVSHLLAVAVAGVVGFLGNEAVATYRIRVGRRIGSAALVADGLHARTDGLTSLAVVLGAGGVAVSWDWADPEVGLVITLAILLVLRDAAREVYHRLMDAVDPALVDDAEAVLAAVPGVRAVGGVRMRWIGHQLRAETDVVVAPELTVVEAHAIAVDAEHALLHAVPRLVGATVHTDHARHDGTTDPHGALSHHADR